MLKRINQRMGENTPPIHDGYDSTLDRGTLGDSAIAFLQNTGPTKRLHPQTMALIDIIRVIENLPPMTFVVCAAQIDPLNEKALVLPVATFTSYKKARDYMRSHVRYGSIKTFAVNQPNYKPPTLYRAEVDKYTGEVTRVFEVPMYRPSEGLMAAEIYPHLSASEVVDYILHELEASSLSGHMGTLQCGIALTRGLAVAAAKANKNHEWE